MDEAKTMWKVGSYHENIVNLQGITVNVELDEISHVSNSFHVNYPFLFIRIELFSGQYS